MPTRAARKLYGVPVTAAGEPGAFVVRLPGGGEHWAGERDADQYFARHEG